MNSIALRRLVRGALIAALYVALTFATSFMSFGPVQFRVSEALTLLPLLLPEAIPGVAIGCLLSNVLMGGLGIFDMVFGPLATLAAALITWKMPNKWLGALPPVVINAIVVGWYLTLLLGEYSMPLNMLFVGIGQAGVCFLLGVPLVTLLQKNQISRFLG